MSFLKRLLIGKSPGPSQRPNGYSNGDYPDREELQTWPLQIPLAIVLPNPSPPGSLCGSVSSSPPSQQQQLPTSPNDSISAPLRFSLIGGRRARSEITPSLPTPPIEPQSLPAGRTIRSPQSTIHGLNVPLIHSPSSPTEQLTQHGDVRILILRTDTNETPLKVTRLLDSFAPFESGTLLPSVEHERLADCYSLVLPPELCLLQLEEGLASLCERAFHFACALKHFLPLILPAFTLTEDGLDQPTRRSFSRSEFIAAVRLYTGYEKSDQLFLFAIAMPLLFLLGSP